MPLRLVKYEDMTTEDHALGLWAEPNDETVWSKGIDEVIEAVLDETEVQDGTLQIYGYVRMDIPSSVLSGEGILEQVIEQVEEEYGDPDGSGVWVATVAVKEAAERLAEQIRHDYPVWPCESVLSVDVDVRKWIEENNPEWLEEEEAEPKGEAEA